MVTLAKPTPCNPLYRPDLESVVTATAARPRVSSPRPRQPKIRLERRISLSRAVWHWECVDEDDYTVMFANNRSGMTDSCAPADLLKMTNRTMPLYPNTSGRMTISEGHRYRNSRTYLCSSAWSINTVAFGQYSSPRHGRSQPQVTKSTVSLTKQPTLSPLPQYTPQLNSRTFTFAGSAAQGPSQP
jgi:hypothetical protein